MGPGDRIEIYKLHKGCFIFGVFFDRFPYEYTLTFGFLKWGLRIGMGQSYLEKDYE